MYEWVKEVNKLVQNLTTKKNNIETRDNMVKNTIRILNKHKISALIDCSPKVNTVEVVTHGSFVMVIDTKEITFTFKYIKEEQP